jgi:fatty acid-binding protein DegV
VIHALAPADAEMNPQELSNRMNCSELEIYDLSPVVGTHVGPGTLGIAVHTVAY